MPYIPDKILREELNYVSKQLVSILEIRGIKGNLNYFLFRTFKHLNLSYAKYSNFEGDCQGALKEIYRRIVAPYEDEKIKENGDVE